MMVADLDQARLDAIRAHQPNVAAVTRDYRQILRSPQVDAVVIATPVSTHARMVSEALLSGKHVLVEKPIAASAAQAEALVSLASEYGLTLMVGHTFLYHPAVRALRAIVQSGELGDVYYLHSQRLNLGLFQRDVNVIWDLAPHDISIFNYLLDGRPLAASARGEAYVQPGIEDVAFVDLVYPDRVRASVHVSWLDPNKVRRTTIVGSRKMVIWDDVEMLEKIRIYDKGVDNVPHTEDFGEFHLSYRYGDITIPHVAAMEPLRVECEHFLECVRTGSRPLTDGQAGLDVVYVLEATTHSLRQASLFKSIAAPGVDNSAHLQQQSRVAVAGQPLVSAHES
jgi:predicted dehydrogenase